MNNGSGLDIHCATTCFIVVIHTNGTSETLRGACIIQKRVVRFGGIAIPKLHAVFQIEYTSQIYIYHRTSRIAICIDRTISPLVDVGSPPAGATVNDDIRERYLYCVLCKIGRSTISLTVASNSKNRLQGRRSASGSRSTLDDIFRASLALKGQRTIYNELRCRGACQVDPIAYTFRDFTRHVDVRRHDDVVHRRI